MKKFLIPLSVVLWALSCRMINISNDLLDVRTDDHPIEDCSTISFENTNGDLELSEWENDFVRVETSIWGDSARGVPDDLKILAEVKDGLSYSVEYPGGPSFVSVDFKVMVPAGSGCIVNSVTVNGDTRIEGDLSVFVESVNGDILINASDSRGLFTVNGDIEAVLERQFQSFADETVNGDVSVELPAEIGLVIETLNGDISVNGREFESIATLEGSIDAAAALETLNGDVEVTRMNR